MRVNSFQEAKGDVERSRAQALKAKRAVVAAAQKFRNARERLKRIAPAALLVARDRGSQGCGSREPEGRQSPAPSSRASVVCSPPDQRPRLGCEDCAASSTPRNTRGQVATPEACSPRSHASPHGTPGARAAVVSAASAAASWATAAAAASAAKVHAAAASRSAARRIARTARARGTDSCSPHSSARAESASPRSHASPSVAQNTRLAPLDASLEAPRSPPPFDLSPAPGHDGSAEREAGRGLDAGGGDAGIDGGGGDARWQAASGPPGDRPCDTGAAEGRDDAVARGPGRQQRMAADEREPASAQASAMDMMHDHEPLKHDCCDPSPMHHASASPPASTSPRPPSTLFFSDPKVVYYEEVGHAVASEQAGSSPRHNQEPQPEYAHLQGEAYGHGEYFDPSSSEAGWDGAREGAAQAVEMGSAVAVAGRSQGARQLDLATEADEDVRALQVALMLVPVCVYRHVYTHIHIEADEDVRRCRLGAHMRACFGGETLWTRPPCRQCPTPWGQRERGARESAGVRRKDGLKTTIVSLQRHPTLTPLAGR